MLEVCGARPVGTCEQRGQGEDVSWSRDTCLTGEMPWEAPQTAAQKNCVTWFMDTHFNLNVNSWLRLEIPQLSRALVAWLKHTCTRERSAWDTGFHT